MKNQNNHIIEFAPFTLVEGVDESALIAASDALQAEFLSQQKGFIRRDLLKTEDGKWADIAWWDSRESVEQAMQNAPLNPAALKYFELIAGSDSHDPSADVMLLNITKSYP